MLDKDFFAVLKNDYAASEKARRYIIGISNGILHGSKRAIFAWHRGDQIAAEAALAEARSSIEALLSEYGQARIEEEGSYRAAMEEFVEAALFSQACRGEEIGAIAELPISTEAYIGGASDLTGELVRRATNLAAAGNYAAVAEQKEIITAVLAELVEMDISGYLRTKYDQAKSNLRKIEQMDFDVKLRKQAEAYESNN